MTNNAEIKKRNFLTQNEIESLLKAADSGPYAARNYCLTLLCFIHGLRASEIIRYRPCFPLRLYPSAKKGVFDHPPFAE